MTGAWPKRLAGIVLCVAGGAIIGAVTAEFIRWEYVAAVAFAGVFLWAGLRMLEDES